MGLGKPDPRFLPCWSYGWMHDWYIVVMGIEHIGGSDLHFSNR